MSLFHLSPDNEPKSVSSARIAELLLDPGATLTNEEWARAHAALTKSFNYVSEQNERLRLALLRCADMEHPQ